MHLRLILAVLLGVAAPSALQATPVNLGQMTMGYTYYNRPGATMSQHDTAVAKCVQATTHVVSINHMIGNDQGLIPALLAAPSAKAVVQAAIENCMIVDGWRVVLLPEAEGAALSAMPLGDLRTRLTPWIGADMPQGTVVRVWNNEAADSETIREESSPSRKEDGQLSVRIAAVGAMDEGTPIRDAGRIDPKWPKRSLSVSQTSTVPADGALLLFRVRGISMKYGTGLEFSRLGADGLPNPSSVDRGADRIIASIGTLFAKKEGNWFIYAVPPGRWRLSGITGGISQLDFCFGAPVFDVKAGETVYAGAYDLSARNLGPDMSIEPATALLAGQRAANTLRPADYVNGSVSQCRTNMAYAYEINGAPFAAGYTGGGAAKAVAP